MSMYVTAGTGEMAAADLKASLDDLESKAVEEERTFWMTVQASAEPTATDRALMAWVTAHETYFETYGPDAAKADDIYKGTQEKHAVKGLAAKIVQLMQEKPEEDEDACLLALFASDDPDAAEDAELYGIVEAVLQAGFRVFAFNDGMGEINLTEGAEEATQEETVEEIPVPSDEALNQEDWTRETLEGLNIDQIKEIAAGFGITFPSRTRAQTYIAAILSRDAVEEEPGEVEVEEPSVGDIQEEQVAEDAAASNGHDDMFDIPPFVKQILRGLGEALVAASK